MSCWRLDSRTRFLGGCWSPARHLSIPFQWMLLLLFAGLAGTEAEPVSQRGLCTYVCTHTRRGGTLTWLATQATTDRALPLAAAHEHNSTHIEQHSPAPPFQLIRTEVKTPPPSLCRFTNTHKIMDPSNISVASPSISCPWLDSGPLTQHVGLLLLAASQMHALAHLSHTDLIPTQLQIPHILAQVLSLPKICSWIVGPSPTLWLRPCASPCQSPACRLVQLEVC